MFKRFFVFSMLIVLALTACTAQTPTEPASIAAPAPQNAQNTLVTVEGNLVPKDYANLAFLSGGKIVEVLVQVGDTVSKGQTLARLVDTGERQAALTAAQLELRAAQNALTDLQNNAGLAAAAANQEVLAAQSAAREAQKRLDDIDTPDYQDKLDQERVKVTDAQDALTTAREDFDKYKDLEPGNAVRKQYEDALKAAEKKYNEAVRVYDILASQLTQAKADLQQAQAALQDAERRAAATQNGPDPDLLALAQARLANAQAQVQAAQAAVDLQTTELKAPFSGVIVRIDFVPGETIAAGQPVMLLADFSEWYVETDDLTELEVVQITAENPARIEADALPGVEIPAIVTRINQFSEIKRGDVTYTVRLRLTPPVPLELRWGMTVVVRFEP
ncbi:MAG: hypothetical protein OHK0052_13060 [Anaerolineales bacterium]